LLVVLMWLALHSALARCRLQQCRNGTPRRSGVPGRVGQGCRAASARGARPRRPAPNLRRPA